MNGEYGTPKQQADHLHQSFKGALNLTRDMQETTFAKDCAKIAAQSHIYSENNSPFSLMNDWRDDNQYWNEVIKEIEQL